MIINSTIKINAKDIIHQTDIIQFKDFVNIFHFQVVRVCDYLILSMLAFMHIEPLLIVIELLEMWQVIADTSIQVLYGI